LLVTTRRAAGPRPAESRPGDLRIIIARYDETSADPGHVPGPKMDLILIIARYDETCAVSCLVVGSEDPFIARYDETAGHGAA